MSAESLEQRIDSLLGSQLQGVLATQHQAQPYTSLMAFAHTPDLRYLLLATFRETQKYANLLSNSWGSFLVDDRHNDAQDYQRATALSASGRIIAVAASEQTDRLSLYLRKHPSLADFVGSPHCALLQMEVDCYRWVDEFQALQLLHPVAQSA